jgi:hypothetical protein
MTAIDLVFFFIFSFFSLPSDAESTNIVLTAIRYEYMVKITQAYWAIILVDVPILRIFYGMTNWKVVQALNIFFQNDCVYPNFIFIFHFDCVLSHNFIHYLLLFFDIPFDSIRHRILNFLNSERRVGNFVVAILPLL